MPLTQQLMRRAMLTARENADVGEYTFNRVVKQGVESFEFAKSKNLNSTGYQLSVVLAYAVVKKMHPEYEDVSPDPEEIAKENGFTQEEIDALYENVIDDSLTPEDCYPDKKLEKKEPEELDVPEEPDAPEQPKAKEPSKTMGKESLDRIMASADTYYNEYFHPVNGKPSMSFDEYLAWRSHDLGTTRDFAQDQITEALKSGKEESTHFELNNKGEKVAVKNGSENIKDAREAYVESVRAEFAGLNGLLMAAKRHQSERRWYDYINPFKWAGMIRENRQITELEDKIKENYVNNPQITGFNEKQFESLSKMYALKTKEAPENFLTINDEGEVRYKDKWGIERAMSADAFIAKTNEDLEIVELAPSETASTVSAEDQQELIDDLDERVMDANVLDKQSQTTEINAPERSKELNK